ncbi:MAG: flagellar hook-associated protein FlgL [Gammaproteobacteria bacterium]|nr:flagellar hook-associated protein FlgL [Gammaproteobacteria bacterium]
MFQQLAVKGILDRQIDISHTQQQLSSGKRILTPSDDPTAAGQAMNVQQLLQINDQYQRNASSGQSQLEFEEEVLTSVGDVLQRTRELAVQGLNGSQGAANRQSIAAEVTQNLEALLGLANTKDGTGKFLFSGYKVQTQPFLDTGAGVYVYQGDQGQRVVQISPLRQIASGDSGYDVFTNLPAAAGGTQDMFKILYDLATSLNANNPSGNSLTDIDTAMNSILRVRGNIGARLSAIDSQKQINEQFQTQMTGALSDIQDLDYASAVSHMNLQMIGMQAAQQTFQKVQGLNLFDYLR